MLSGWIAKYLQKLAENSQVCMPVNDCAISPKTGPLKLAHPNITSLVKACQIAVQGAATKVATAVECPAAPGAWTMTIAQRAFGWVFSFEQSLTNFPCGNINFQVAMDADPLRTFTYNVKGSKNKYEFLILSIVSNAGIGEVVPCNSVVVTIDIPNSAVVRAVAGPPATPGTYISGETLNARDLRLVSRD